MKITLRDYTSWVVLAIFMQLQLRTRITSRFLTVEVRIQSFAAHLRDLLDLTALHIIQ